MRLPLHSPRTLVTLVVFVMLAALPLLTQAFDQRYLLSIGTRIVIWSIAATSLNMILGYGGMVSFGHAAFFGIGGYAVGILSASGIQDGWIQWPVALLASAAWATLVGALSLRTRGVYFIMITLAFAQLVYYLSSGLEAYGGDDGLNISRSRFAGLIDLRDKASFYWLCLALLGATLWFCSRFAESRFGLVIRGARSNELRMQALGFPVALKIVAPELGHKSDIGGVALDLDGTGRVSLDTGVPFLDHMLDQVGRHRAEVDRERRGLELHLTLGAQRRGREPQEQVERDQHGIVHRLRAEVAPARARQQREAQAAQQGEVKKLLERLTREREHS